MALVFPMFIVRELLSQKIDKRCNKAYSSYGEGASKTKSSAYANINNYIEAIVYAVRLASQVPLDSKYYNR